MKLTSEEEKVLLALSELEPASLEALSDNTKITGRRLQKILDSLAKRNLLRSFKRVSKSDWR